MVQRWMLPGQRPKARAGSRPGCVDARLRRCSPGHQQAPMPVGIARPAKARGEAEPRHAGLARPGFPTPQSGRILRGSYESCHHFFLRAHTLVSGARAAREIDDTAPAHCILRRIRPSPPHLQDSALHLRRRPQAVDRQHRPLHLPTCDPL